MSSDDMSETTFNNQSSTKSNDVAPLAPSIPPNRPQQTSDINYGKGERITVLHVAEKPSIGQVRTCCNVRNKKADHGLTSILTTCMHTSCLIFGKTITGHCQWSCR
jgi:hypothetical protein